MADNLKLQFWGCSPLLYCYLTLNFSICCNRFPWCEDCEWGAEGVFSSVVYSEEWEMRGVRSTGWTVDSLLHCRIFWGCLWGSFLNDCVTFKFGRDECRELVNAFKADLFYKYHMLYIQDAGYIFMMITTLLLPTCFALLIIRWNLSCCIDFVATMIKMELADAEKRDVLLLFSVFLIWKQYSSSLFYKDITDLLRNFYNCWYCWIGHYGSKTMSLHKIQSDHKDCMLK